MKPFPNTITYNKNTGSNNVIVNAEIYLKSFMAQYNNINMLTDEENRIIKQTLEILDNCKHKETLKYLNRILEK